MGKSLTAELILVISKTDKLTAIKNLNLWGNELEDVSILRDMPNVEILSLSLNKISSLKDFASCTKLTELYLRKNAISDIREIKYLAGMRALKVLWLWDNPISLNPNYRSFVIKTLPNLVKLDNTAVAPEERVSAQKIDISAEGLDFSEYVQPSPQINPVHQEVISSAFSQPTGPPAQIETSGFGGMNPVGHPQKQAEHPSQIVKKEPYQVAQQRPQTSSRKKETKLSRSPEAGNEHRNENILCAVLALLKELDESGLELVKRDIERKLAMKQQQYE